MPAPQVVLVQMQRPGLLAEHWAITVDVTCGRALRRRPAMVWSTVRRGLVLSIRLIVPATTGAAKLVPKTFAYPAGPGAVVPRLYSVSKPPSVSSFQLPESSSPPTVDTTTSGPKFE